jgi:pyruvyl transferase EpsO
VRDEPSRAFAGAELGIKAVLTPDAALALGPLRTQVSPHRAVLVLARTDHEARADRRSPASMAVEDWTVARSGLHGRVLWRIAAELDRRPGRSEAMSAMLARGSLLAWGGVSKQHLARGIELLASAEVVVTDRLHAHILSLLLGIPHVVTDNVSGKIRGFYEAWTGESPLVTWADSLEQGVDIARGIAGAPRLRASGRAKAR